MPKLMTFRKLPYSGEIWNYNITTVPGGEEKTYFLFKETKLDLGQNVFGKLNVFLPEDCEGIMLDAQLRNLRDKQGNEIYPDGTWYLTGVSPSLNLYGGREGFRAVAQLSFLVRTLATGNG